MQLSSVDPHGSDPDLGEETSSKLDLIQDSTEKKRLPASVQLQNMFPGFRERIRELENTNNILYMKEQM